MAGVLLQFAGNQMVSWAFLIAAGLLVYFNFVSQSRVDRMLRKFPGPRSFPILGHAHQLIRPEETLQIMDGWFKQYGKRCRVYFGTANKCLMLCDPSDFEKVASAQELTDKSALYDHLRDWLGDGIITSQGNRWRLHRKLLTPAFRKAVLKSFQPVFDERSKALVEILKNFSGKECEIQHLLHRCTLDAICETAMGEKLNSQQDKNNEYMKTIVRQNQLMMKKWTSPWLSSPSIWNSTSYGKEDAANRQILRSFVSKVIEERKKHFSLVGAIELPDSDNEGEMTDVHGPTKKRFAFLDLLLNIQATGKQELMDEDIVVETNAVMFTGHDTAATVMTWTIYRLGLHHQHQAKVHEELDSVFGEDKSRPLDYTDLPKLKYLEMCINESMRLYPIVPFFSRAVREDFKLDANSTIPKGAIAMFNVYSAHRDPDTFQNPEEYMPDRFSAENCRNRHRYAFMPFSAGPRDCIGRHFGMIEMKTILGNVFRNFRIESLDPLENVTPMAEVMLKPKDGIRIKLFPR